MALVAGRPLPWAGHCSGEASRGPQEGRGAPTTGKGGAGPGPRPGQQSPLVPGPALSRGRPPATMLPCPPRLAPPGPGTPGGRPGARWGDLMKGYFQGPARPRLSSGPNICRRCLVWTQRPSSCSALINYHLQRYIWFPSKGAL
jgi:hypothetical protein